MSARADQRAARFGLNLYLNCVTNALTVGQITEVIHCYVRSQSADTNRQYELTQVARKGFASGSPNVRTRAPEFTASGSRIT